jgi:opacity protein-like surface antigen
MKATHKQILPAIALVGALGLATAQAQQLEITPNYGYRFGGTVQNSLTGQSYNFQDAPAYGLTLDYAPDTNSGGELELMWSRQDTSVNLGGLAAVGKVNLSIDQIQLGGSMQTAGQHLREYVSVLLGGTYYSPDGYNDDLRFSLSIGGGVKYFFTKNIALRGDLRGYCTFIDTSSAFISHNGTTLVAFSGSTIWQGQATIGLTIAF